MSVTNGKAKKVVVDADQTWDQVKDTVMSALAARPDIYVHNNCLVRLLAATDPMVVLDNDNHRKMLIGDTVSCVTMKAKRKREVEAPIAWAHGIGFSLPESNQFRIFHEFSDAPLLVLKDGGLHVLAKPGYHRLDNGKGVYIRPHRIDVPDGPMPACSVDDAVRARELLMEIVEQFPWETEADKSAWLALVLTLVGRHLYTGVHPGWLFKAAARGVGKSLSAQLAIAIATGTQAKPAAFPNMEELNKLLLGQARDGKSIVLWDNVKHHIEGDMLEAQITAGSISGRILGNSKVVEQQWRPVHVFTANGATASRDMAERLLIVKLAGEEGRRDMEFPDAEQAVTDAAGSLFAAACTILTASWQARERGEQVRVCPWGSFSEWVQVVPVACVFCGLPDIKTTQQDFIEEGEQPGVECVVGLWNWQRRQMGPKSAQRWSAKTLRDDLSRDPSLRADVVTLLAGNSPGMLQRIEMISTQQLNKVLDALVRQTERRPVLHNGLHLAFERGSKSRQPTFLVIARPCVETEPDENVALP